MRQIEDFYHDDDGDNWAPAFRRAIDSFDPSHHYARGGLINFGPRTYRFQQSIQLTRQVILDGEGGPGWFGSTRLLFDDGVAGIIVHHANTFPESAKVDSRGSWSIIRNLVIEAVGQTIKAANGITLLDRATVEHVYVTNFSGIGICIDADGGHTPPSNANTWRINDVYVEGCGSHGLFVNGGDANAGVAVALNASSNGGWGVFDSSFLGNTYIGAHTASNKLGSYKSDNPNARNFFLNCYAEEDQNPSEIAPPAMVIGGIISLSDKTRTIALTAEGFGATFPHGVRSSNRHGTVNVTGQLGSEAGVGNVAYEFAQGPEQPWRMTFDGGDDWWKLRYAGLDDSVGYAVSDRNAREGRGQFWLPNGFWLGEGSRKAKQQMVQRGQIVGIEYFVNGAARFVGWADASPTDGDFNAGDLIWNSSSSSVAGWRFDGTMWSSF